jgi:RNA polymerase sigma-70 factor (sigma-E family)
MAEGFEARFDTLFRCAYQGAYKITGNRDDSEEIAQEALARCLVRWRRVEGYAEAFVTRTAINMSIDQWRRHDRHARTRPLDRELVHEDPHAELRADLVDALQSLSRRQRDVVVLRYLMDVSERQVARTLGCTEGTVKQHAQRGLAALRERLGEVPLGGEDLIAGEGGAV